MTKEEISDYTNLFNDSAKTKLHFFNTIKSNVRQPESQYIFNSHYNVFVTKFPIHNQFDATKMIVVRHGKSEIDDTDLSFSIRGYQSKIHIVSEKIPLVSDVTLKTEDRTIKTIYIDTDRASYYFKIQTFSLMLNDVKYLVGKTSTIGYINVTLLKKGDFLYLVLLTNGDEHGHVFSNMSELLLRDK